MAYVADANCMVSRMALCAMFGMALGVKFILEQPLSSLMPRHPRLAKLIEMSEQGGVPFIERVHTSMGAFGHFSVKPTMLLGTVSWLAKLRRSFKKKAGSGASGTSRVYIDSSGAKRFTGTKQLKRTQEYPIEYGRACASLFCKEHQDQDPVVVDDDHAFDFDILADIRADAPEGADVWADAQIGGAWKRILTQGRRC